jgi:hypothetical protein
MDLAGMATAASPELFSTVFVASQRGVIMRGRKRSRPWPPARTADAFPHGHGAETEADAQTDEVLRAFVRLLARQAARELFEQSLTRTDAGQTCDEDLE